MTETTHTARRPFGGRRAGSVSAQFLILLAFLAAVVIIFATQNSNFLSTPNVLNILSISAVIGLVSLGQVLPLISGGFDLSVSGVVPLAGVLFAVLTNAGLPFLPALLAVLAAGAIVGLINGLLITRARINPLIATLGTLSVVGGLALVISNGLQIPFTNPDVGVLSSRGLFGVNNQVWIFIGLAIVAHIVLRFTAYGRRVYAVGGNQEAARLAGIRVNTTTTSVYMLCSVFAALAGIVLASQLLTGSGTAGINTNLQSITAVILGGAALTGGVGGVPGTVLGVLILGALSNGMSLTHVPSFYQTIATGLVLLAAVGLSQIRRRRQP